MRNYRPFVPKKFNLSGLNGISDQTLEMHFRLYEGFVDAANELMARISEYATQVRDDPEYAELKRRLVFEYYGMLLHECYFDSLKKGGGGQPARDSAFHKAIERNLGSYNLWKEDFITVGKVHGLGC
jgi:Fe-Mn family superoxide dismutase